LNGGKLFWAVVGFFLCVISLFFCLVYYASQSTPRVTMDVLAFGKTVDRTWAGEPCGPFQSDRSGSWDGPFTSDKAEAV